MPEATQVRLSLFKGGYCTHQEKMVLRTGSRKQIAFPSLFALIEHPSEGPMLFDTGYGSHFFSATDGFPERIYRMVTPVTLDSGDTAVSRLAAAGYRPEDVKRILISHFHGDHIAALRDFPRARFVFLEQGYSAVRPLTGARAVRIGYLPALLPRDFESRAEALNELRGEPVAPFARSHDLFRDGSIRLIPLEGHFCGQMGALLNTTRGPVLLVADACWLRASFDQPARVVLPHPLAMGIMHDRAGYLNDLQLIQRFHQTRPDVPVIPSHCTRSIDAWQQHADRAGVV